MKQEPPVIGVDFGTTNSVVAMFLPDGKAHCWRHNRASPRRAFFLNREHRLIF